MKQDVLLAKVLRATVVARTIPQHGGTRNTPDVNLMRDALSHTSGIKKLVLAVRAIVRARTTNKDGGLAHHR